MSFILTSCAGILTPTHLCVFASYYYARQRYIFYLEYTNDFLLNFNDRTNVTTLGCKVNTKNVLR